MLGFSAFSEAPLGSLASVEFYIRGDSTLDIYYTNQSFGRLDIFGNQVTMLDVSTSSVGFIKIAKRRKIMIAQAVTKSISSRRNTTNIYATEDKSSSYATAPSKKIDVL